MDKEILNLEEAAELLDLSPRTLRRAAARGEVPGRRIARQWRFSRTALHDWLAGRGPTDNWLKYAGVLAHSPFLDEVTANIEAEREQQRAEARAQAEVEER